MKREKRIGIFYISYRRKGQKQRQPVFIAGDPSAMVYVRCGIAKSRTLSDALSEAKPRRGESVMNTHYID